MNRHSLPDFISKDLDRDPQSAAISKDEMQDSHIRLLIFVPKHCPEAPAYFYFVCSGCLLEVEVEPELLQFRPLLNISVACLFLFYRV